MIRKIFNKGLANGFIFGAVSASVIFILSTGFIKPAQVATLTTIMWFLNGMAFGIDYLMRSDVKDAIFTTYLLIAILPAIYFMISHFISHLIVNYKIKKATYIGFTILYLIINAVSGYFVAMTQAGY